MRRHDLSLRVAAPATLLLLGLVALGVHPTERGHVFASPAAGGLFENRLSD